MHGSHPVALPHAPTLTLRRARLRPFQMVYCYLANNIGANAGGTQGSTVRFALAGTAILTVFAHLVQIYRRTIATGVEVPITGAFWEAPNTCTVSKDNNWLYVGSVRNATLCSGSTSPAAV